MIEFAISQFVLITVGGVIGWQLRGSQVELVEAERERDELFDWPN